MGNSNTYLRLAKLPTLLLKKKTQTHKAKTSFFDRLTVIASDMFKKLCISTYVFFKTSIILTREQRLFELGVVYKYIILLYFKNIF